MGTDHISRDLLARNSIGLGRTIKHGFIAVFVGWVVGITIGYTAGWRGGRTDTLIMRGVDVLLAFPGIVFAILLITIIGSGIFSVAVAIAFFNIPGSARLASEPECSGNGSATTSSPAAASASQDAASSSATSRPTPSAHSRSRSRSRSSPQS